MQEPSTKICRELFYPFRLFISKTRRRVGPLKKPTMLNFSLQYPPCFHFYVCDYTTHHEPAIQIVINERKSRGDLPFTRIGPIFAQGYIIPSNFSFHSSSGANKHSCKLMAEGRQQFCGDTMNIFGSKDQNFQWSRAYSYYSSHSTHNEVIWTSGIARAGCVPEVFDYKEVVSWCAKKYISS